MPAMPVPLTGKVRCSWLQGLAQHLLGLVHERQELRIEMADERRGHDGRARADARPMGRAPASKRGDTLSWPGSDTLRFLSRSGCE